LRILGRISGILGIFRILRIPTILVTISRNSGRISGISAIYSRVSRILGQILGIQFGIFDDPQISRRILRFLVILCRIPRFSSWFSEFFSQISRITEISEISGILGRISEHSYSVFQK